MILKHARYDEIIKTNPADGLGIKSQSRSREEVVVPSREDVATILKAVDELALSTHKQTAKAWVRYRPLIYLAAKSGLRASELRGLPV